LRLKDLTSILSCPVDHSNLEYNPEFFRCIECKGEYPILGTDFVELLPELPSPHNEDSTEYWKEYQTEFKRSFAWMDNAQAWGRCDLVRGSWAVKRLRQVERVKSILDETQVICDVSAGAGTYTFEFAKTFPLVIHCDLSVENLNDVYSQKQQKAIDNLVLIRSDYFNLPFNNTLQQLICTDTLIRGRQHEICLLNSLCRALSDGGKALVDFHNWWHNPLRRLGLMPQNFGSNKSYTRKTAENILLDAGITEWKYYSYLQEISPEKNSVFKQIIPTTRLMYLFEK
jgi:ubiquinone/menaquinone biosynthesis C-methylase UbiE